MVITTEHLSFVLHGSQVLAVTVTERDIVLARSKTTTHNTLQQGFACDLNYCMQQALSPLGMPGRPRPPSIPKPPRGPFESSEPRPGAISSTISWGGCPQDCICTITPRVLTVASAHMPYDTRIFQQSMVSHMDHLCQLLCLFMCYSRCCPHSDICAGSVAIGSMVLCAAYAALGSTAPYLSPTNT